MTQCKCGEPFTTERPEIIVGDTVCGYWKPRFSAHRECVTFGPASLVSPAGEEPTSSCHIVTFDSGAHCYTHNTDWNLTSSPPVTCVLAGSPEGEPRPDELPLRKRVWLNHICVQGTLSTAYLYGDDGEMTCTACLLDFRRDPISVIDAKLAELELLEFAARSTLVRDPESPLELLRLRYAIELLDDACPRDVENAQRRAVERFPGSVPPTPVRDEEPREKTVEILELCLTALHYNDPLRSRVMALIARLRSARGDEDTARLDAIERGEIELECMGTTVRYFNVYGANTDMFTTAGGQRSLREIIDAARGSARSPHPGSPETPNA